MSSDSEDDFSYTNTASILKALKKNISISEDNYLPIEDVDKHSDDVIMLNHSDDDEDDLCLTERAQRHLKPKKNVARSSTNKDISCTTGSLANNNDSLIILSDEELINSPINLISKIDSVLIKAKRRSKSNTKTKPKTSRTLRKRISVHAAHNSEINRIPARVSRSNARRCKSTSRRTKQKQNNFEVLNISDTCPIENNDLQESNYDVDIKVLWMSQYLKKFSIRRFDKIQTIFKFFSERENIPENKLLFTIEKDGVILSRNDTPDSLNINAATIIEGGRTFTEETQRNTSKPDKNSIELKVQLKDRKRPLTITIKSGDRLGVLMHKTATELDVDVKSLKFYFDGDLIKSNDTVENLELQDGECIDCIKTN